MLFRQKLVPIPNASTAESWDTSVLTAAHLVANAAGVVQTALGAVDRVPGGHPLDLDPDTSLDPRPLVYVILTLGLQALGIEVRGVAVTTAKAVGTARMISTVNLLVHDGHRTKAGLVTPTHRVDIPHRETTGEGGNGEPLSQISAIKCKSTGARFGVRVSTT